MSKRSKKAAEPSDQANKKVALEDPRSVSEIQLLNDLVLRARTTAAEINRDQDPGPEERLLLIISPSAEDALNLIVYSPTQCPFLGDSLAPPSPPPEFADIQRWTTIRHALTWEPSLFREVYQDHILGHNMRDLGIVIHQAMRQPSHPFFKWKILMHFISIIPRLSRLALYVHASRPTNMSTVFTWKWLWEQCFPHALPRETLTHLTLDLTFIASNPNRNTELTLPLGLQELQDFRFAAQSVPLFLARLDDIARERGPERLAIYLHNITLDQHPNILACLRQTRFSADAILAGTWLQQVWLAPYLCSLTLQITNWMDLSLLGQLTALYELRLEIAAQDAWYDPAAFFGAAMPLIGIRALTISLLIIPPSNTLSIRNISEHPIRLNLAPLFPHMETLLLKLVSHTCGGCRPMVLFNSPIRMVDAVEAWEMSNNLIMRQCFVHTVEQEPLMAFARLRLVRAMYLMGPSQISDLIILVNFVP